MDSFLKTSQHKLIPFEDMNDIIFSHLSDTPILDKPVIKQAIAKYKIKRIRDIIDQADTR